MRVLQISTEFDSSKLGGAEKMVYCLSSHLSKAGHDVSILTCEESAGFDNVDIITIPRPMDMPTVYWQSPISIFSMFNIGHYFRLRRIFKEFDIIHFHNIHSYSLLFYSMAAAKSLKTKKIWTPHDYWFSCPNQALLTDDGKICEDPKKCNQNCKRSGLRKLFSFRHHTTRLLHSMDMALPTSEYAKNRLMEFGMEPDKIQTVYNGVEITPISQDNEIGQHILFIGYMDKRKGTYTLLKAMPEVIKRIPDAKLKFMGDGPERKGLEKLANKLGVEEAVEFTGRLSDKEFEEVFQSSRLIVVPSIWPEIFGLVSAEAMVRNKAVIASNVGAIPEIVMDGETGLLFEPGDHKDLAKKIISIYDDLAKLEEFGKEGRIIAKKRFDVADYSKTVEEVYKKL